MHMFVLDKGGSAFPNPDGLAADVDLSRALSAFSNLHCVWCWPSSSLTASNTGYSQLSTTLALK
jgi:hypothetical protein